MMYYGWFGKYLWSQTKLCINIPHTHIIYHTYIYTSKYTPIGSHIMCSFIIGGISLFLYWSNIVLYAPWLYLFLIWKPIFLPPHDFWFRSFVHRFAMFTNNNEKTKSILMGDNILNSILNSINSSNFIQTPITPSTTIIYLYHWCCCCFHQTQLVVHIEYSSDPLHKKMWLLLSCGKT